LIKTYFFVKIDEIFLWKKHAFLFTCF